MLTPESFKNGNQICSRAENVRLEIDKERIRDKRRQDMLKIKQNAAQRCLVKERYTSAHAL